MDFISTRIPYRQTRAFSKIALDYIDQSPPLKPYFDHPPALQGVRKAIEERGHFKTDRETLARELKKQYGSVKAGDKVNKNIDSLLLPTTFTVTTAHQNNLFTGPLYFIYKIVHAIKLADHLNSTLPANHFVPVFYMGTEDADLEELNHIYLGGEKLEWKTSQQGAVGRMKIDKELITLMGRMEGELLVQPFGKQIMDILRECYKAGEDIQTATFRLVHSLFGDLGLVVLLPDNAEFKKQMVPVFGDELSGHTASAIVEKTATELAVNGYKVQAHPREINLFYLEGHIRQRIEKKQDKYVLATGEKIDKTGQEISFTAEEIQEQLRKNPERFSPNVILRGLYQETLLPNIAFIGGAGEVAYWLQLKPLFDHYKIPYPVLVLRNSFLVVEKKWQEKLAGLGLMAEDLFNSEEELMAGLVARESSNNIKLNGSLSKVEELYEAFKKQAAAIDPTLEKHVDALRTNTVYRLHELEKKMLRAEKRKYTDHQRQLHVIREQLFPGNGLQERRENLGYYYAKWGKEFLDQLYHHSPELEQEFVILSEKSNLRKA